MGCRRRSTRFAHTAGAGRDGVERTRSQPPRSAPRRRRVRQRASPRRRAGVAAAARAPPGAPAPTRSGRARGARAAAGRLRQRRLADAARAGRQEGAGADALRDAARNSGNSGAILAQFGAILWTRRCACTPSVAPSLGLVPRATCAERPPPTRRSSCTPTARRSTQRGSRLPQAFWFETVCLRAGARRAVVGGRRGAPLQTAMAAQPAAAASGGKGVETRATEAWRCARTAGWAPCRRRARRMWRPTGGARAHPGLPSYRDEASGIGAAAIVGGSIVVADASCGHHRGDGGPSDGREGRGGCEGLPPSAAHPLRPPFPPPSAATFDPAAGRGPRGAQRGEARDQVVGRRQGRQEASRFKDDGRQLSRLD